jgi:fused signal recognition particle receptor
VPHGIGLDLVLAAGVVSIVAAAIVIASRIAGKRSRPEVKAQTDGVTGTPASSVAVQEPVPKEAVDERAGVEAPERPPSLEEVVAPPERLRPTLRERLAKSRRFFAARVGEAFGTALDDETWEFLESALIQADVGVEATARIINDLKAAARDARITNPDEARSALAQELLTVFESDRDRGLAFAPAGPTVWLVMGVNGTGKTTTIGKLAGDLTNRGRSVALAAADTFRAAADDQLEFWARRTGAGLIKHQPGADPGAVAFDAFQHARARGYEVVIVDTAGRLHTKRPLMDELAKIRRVIEKEGRVDEALLVIDATAGQNGLAQAREFAEKAAVTGIALTKLDGTAKGGIALTIEHSLGIPIKLIGVGEGVDDLEPFDPKRFVDALLS